MNVNEILRHVTRALSVKEANAFLQKQRRGAENRTEASTGRRYALSDIDSVDVSQYNEVKLSGEEMARLQSEAMTWHANKRGVPIRKTLGGISYLCVIDNDGIVHCYSRELSQNIHEDRSNYRDRGTEQLDRFVEGLRPGRGVDRGDGGVGQNGREQTDADRLDHREVRSEGRSDGRGRGQDASSSRGRKKVVRYKFDEDGSGHGVKYYSDGTTERFALSEDADASASKDAAKKKRSDTTLRELDTWAKENVKGYRDLLPAEKREIRALVRQARAVGISDADIKTYAAVSARSGVRIAFSKERAALGKDAEGRLKYSDSFYDPAKNEIVVNPEGKRSTGRLLFHELSHALYGNKRFAKALDKAVRWMDEARGEEIAGRYREAGRTDAAELSEELAVHHAEDVLGNRENLARLLRDEPTIGDKILSFFDLAKTEYRGNERLSRAAGRLYRHFEAALAEFSAENRGNLAAETVTSTNGEHMQVSEDGRRYAFAGEKAETANKLTLENAKAMLEKGADSEKVRKETGWFKGYDGKWRFEIDDLDSFLIEDPKLKKHTDGGEVYFTGTLSDIFSHKDLFSAYPGLKSINVVIQKTNPGVEAIYQPKSNYITLSIEHFKRYTKAYSEHLNGARKAEIEKIEASSAYREYNRLYDDAIVDAMDPLVWLEAEKEARDKFYSSEIGKRYYQLMWGKDNGFIGDKFELGWGKEAKTVLLHELQHAIQKEEGFASGTNTRDQNYDRNAGEIEANDVGRRSNMTSEERKNTRPDIDREDVVVSNRGTVYYLAKDKNPENDSIKKQIREHLDELGQMEPAAEIQFDPAVVSDNVKAKKMFLAEVKKTGEEIDRKDFGIILIGKDEVGTGMGYVHTPAERAALFSVPRVLKRGKIISSHLDHKSNGFPSVTIAAPVVINGKRGIVGVIVQQTGKNKYHAHRILLPNGDVFVINKNDAELSTASMLSKYAQQRLPNSSAPVNSIPDSDEKSKPLSQKTSSNQRHALPDTAPDTTDAVGKERRRYKPSKADAFFTAKDRTYIETVDELYAVTKYLRKLGGHYYEVTLSIGHKGTVATVYNVGKIKEGVSPSAKIIAVVESKLPWETPSDTSIPDSGEKSNLSDEISSEPDIAMDEILRPKPGQLTFYKGGKKITMEISKELAFYNFHNSRVAFLYRYNRVCSLPKKLLTRGGL